MDKPELALTIANVLRTAALLTGSLTDAVPVIQRVLDDPETYAVYMQMRRQAQARIEAQMRKGRAPNCF